MSTINRRKAEEIMMRLLISQETEQDIIHITDAISDSIWKLTYEIRNYFDTHIKPYCGDNNHKITSRLSNQKLIESFINLFPNEDHNAYLQSLATEIKASFCKGNVISNDNKKTNTNNLYIYLDYLHKDSIEKISIEEVIDIDLVFCLLSQFNKDLEPILIQFICSIYHQGNESFKNSLIRRLILELGEYQSTDDTQRVFKLLLKENERNGTPGLVIYKMPSQLNLYDVTVSINNGTRCKLTLYEYTTVYEFRTLIMIKLCINIDLYTILYQEKELNIDSDMYLKPISELFKTNIVNEPINKYTHCNIPLTITLNKSLLDSLEEIKSEYYDKKGIKPLIKSQLNLLFIYFRNRELILNTLFAFDISTIINLGNSIRYSFNTFLNFLDNHSNDHIKVRYLFLHLLIGFRKGNLNDPYLRNIQPNDLIRNQIGKFIEHCELLQKEIDDYYPVSDYSQFYTMLIKLNHNFDTIYQQDYIYKNTQTLNELQTSVMQKVFEEDINEYNAKNNFKYKLLFKYAESLFENIPGYILLINPKNLWIEKYYCKIWLNIFMSLKDSRVIKYIISQCSPSLLTIGIITNYNISRLLLSAFNLFSSIEDKENSGELYSFTLFQALLQLINKNNIKQVLNEDILLMYTDLIKTMINNSKKYHSCLDINNKQFESLEIQISSSQDPANISLYIYLLYQCKRYFNKDNDVFNTLKTNLVNKVNFIFEGICSDIRKHWPINHILIQLYNCLKYINYNKIKNLILLDTVSLETALYHISQKLPLSELYESMQTFAMKNDLNNTQDVYKVIEAVLGSIKNKKKSSLFYYYYSKDNTRINPNKTFLIVSSELLPIDQKYEQIGCIMINKHKNDELNSICNNTDGTFSYYSSNGSKCNIKIEYESINYYFYAKKDD